LVRQDTNFYNLVSNSPDDITTTIEVAKVQDVHTDKLTNRQTIRWTDKWTNRESNGQTIEGLVSEFKAARKDLERDPPLMVSHSSTNAIDICAYTSL
jgi:protein required for attachment to host cells